MPSRSSAASILRLAVAVAVLLAVALPVVAGNAGGQPGRAIAAGGPRVAYLFGSGSATGGRAITLRVQLTAPAPAGGAQVALGSEAPGVIPLPASVEVPAGQTERTISVTTLAVTQTVRVRVSASYGGATKGREVVVKEPDLRTLSVQSVIRGGGQGRMTVCLTGVAYAGGVTVALAAEPAELLAVPATAVVPAGDDCVSLAVSAAEVRGDTAVRVTAAFDGASRSANAVVRDFPGPAPATSTPTATGTATDIPTSTATSTPIPPTATATNTAVPATATPTDTPVPPTSTPVPPTATPTDTPVPTSTPTETPVPTSTPTSTPIATEPAFTMDLSAMLRDDCDPSTGFPPILFLTGNGFEPGRVLVLSATGPIVVIPQLPFVGVGVGGVIGEIALGYFVGVVPAAVTMTLRDSVTTALVYEETISLTAADVLTCQPEAEGHSRLADRSPYTPPHCSACSASPGELR